MHLILQTLVSFCLSGCEDSVLCEHWEGRRGPDSLNMEHGRPDLRMEDCVPLTRGAGHMEGLTRAWKTAFEDTARANCPAANYVERTGSGHSAGLHVSKLRKGTLRDVTETDSGDATAPKRETVVRTTPPSN